MDLLENSIAEGDIIVTDSICHAIASFFTNPKGVHALPDSVFGTSGCLKLIFEAITLNKSIRRNCIYTLSNLAQSKLNSKFKLIDEAAV